MQKSEAVGANVSLKSKAWALTEALGNKTSLVSLNGAISIALHLENPSRANGSAPCRQVC